VKKGHDDWERRGTRDDRNRISDGRNFITKFGRVKKICTSKAKIYGRVRTAAACFLLALTLLDGDELIDVAHTLALVRLRLALGADDGGEVAHLHLVEPGDGDLRVAITLALQPDGDVEDHLVRVAEGQVDGLALHDSLVADTHELQLFLEASRHTHHHVVRQGPVQTVTLPRALALVQLANLNRSLTLEINRKSLCE
jgi:hypothetical protein